jgi:hypothetical protein
MSNDMILQYFRFGDNGIDGEDISDVIVGQPYITDARFVPNSLPFSSSGYLVSTNCNFLLTFNTGIVDLTLDKFTTINCTLSSLSGSSGQSTYNFIVTPSSRPGTFSISLDANKVTDFNGIGNIASEIYSKYAPAAPTCTITDNISGNVNVGGSVTFTFTWSEGVTGFDSADISVTGGAKGTFSGSGSSYSLSVTQSGSSDSITISFGANVCTSSSTGMSNINGASYSQSVSQYMIIYTDLLTPSKNYIGTYDDFRGGGYNSRSTYQSINSICNLANRYYGAVSLNPVAGVDYSCATTGSAQSRSNGNWLYPTGRTGEGYCTDYGVHWVRCKQLPPATILGFCGVSSTNLYNSSSTIFGTRIDNCPSNNNIGLFVYDIYNYKGSLPGTTNNFLQTVGTTIYKWDGTSWSVLASTFNLIGFELPPWSVYCF